MEAPNRKVDVTVHDRATALSVQLILTHRSLRERLSVLRDRLDAGDPDAPELWEHCAGFCAALEEHHTGEDGGLFPALRREFPELAPVIDKLVEDHWLIAGILRRVRDLTARARAGGDPAAVAGELDGLAAIMDSHFAFEERRVRTAMDALVATRDEVLADRWLV